MVPRLYYGEIYPVDLRNTEFIKREREKLIGYSYSRRT
jgi:hypothetical protein